MTKNEIEKIYKDNVGIIYRYIFFKLNDKQTASDFTQEVFLRFIGNKNMKIDNIKAFLFGIAKNLLRDKYKLEKTTSIDSLEDQQFELQNEEVSLESVAINEQLTQEIRTKLSSMDPTTKDVIMLKVWDELKFEEIADILSLNINKVKAVYYRGITSLKSYFERGNRKVSIALILGGILGISKLAEFAVPSTLTSTLIFSSAGMSGFSLASLLSTTAGKIVAGTFAIASVAVVGIGTDVVVNKTTQPNASNHYSQACSYGEQKYSIGQTFASIDGCNTCTCSENGTVFCTEIACDSQDGQDENNNNVVTKDYSYSFTVDEPWFDKTTFDLSFKSKDQNITIIGNQVKHTIKGDGFEMESFVVLTGTGSGHLNEFTKIGNNPNFGDIAKHKINDGSSSYAYTNRYQESNCFEEGSPVNPPCGIGALIKDYPSNEGSLILVLKCISTNDSSKCDDIALSFNGNKTKSEEIFKDKVWFNNKIYPQEIQGLKRSDLYNTWCEPNYTTYSGTLQDANGFPAPAEIVNAVTVLEGAYHKSIIQEIQKCEIKDPIPSDQKYIQTIYVYQYCKENCGGGVNTTHGVEFFYMDGYQVDFPNSGMPYPTCHNILAIKKDGSVYLDCRGGDGGYSGAEIIKVSLTNSTFTRIAKEESITPIP